MQVELKTWNDPPNDFQDSFYLATHVVYAMSAYSGIKVAVEDCPWVYRYIRKSYRFWMKQDKLKRTQVRALVSEVCLVCESIEMNIPRRMRQEQTLSGYPRWAPAAAARQLLIHYGDGQT
jgi:hypothetical protein